MRIKTLLIVVLTVVATGVLSGCLWAPELDGVRKDIESQVPGAEFKKEFAISLGPIALALARGIVGLIPDTEEARAYLKQIRRVKLAVYDVEKMPPGAEIEMPERLTKLIEKDDWDLAARVREDGENVWLLYREKGDKVEEIYVVALDERELVLVRVSGHIDRLLALAMEDELDVPPELFFTFISDLL